MQRLTMMCLQTFAVSLWFVIIAASPKPTHIKGLQNGLFQVVDDSESADTRGDVAAEIKDAPRIQEVISNLRKFSLEADLKEWDNISERCKKNSVTSVSCSTSQLDSEDNRQVTKILRRTVKEVAVFGQDGLLPHPDDCGLFYYCVSWWLPPVCRDCPGDLHFNPTKYVCDDPDRAGCTLSSTTAALES